MQRKLLSSTCYEPATGLITLYTLSHTAATLHGAWGPDFTDEDTDKRRRSEGVESDWHFVSHPIRLPLTLRSSMLVELSVRAAKSCTLSPWQLRRRPQIHVGGRRRPWCLPFTSRASAFVGAAAVSHGVKGTYSTREAVPAPAALIQGSTRSRKPV